MNELIKVTLHKNRQVVSARELYKGLEIKKRFSAWVNQNFDDFIEDEDFMSVPASTDMPNGGTKQILDFAITIDMAKELALVSRTSNGKKYREYFIELERKWNDPKEVVRRGYDILKDQNAQLKLENQHLKPAAAYTEKMLANPGLETTSVIAKNYGMSTAKFNQLLHELGIQYRQGKTWLLYAKYQDCGYTHVEPFAYFDQKVGTKKVANTMKWTQLGQKFLYDFLASQHILPQVERLVLRKG